MQDQPTAVTTTAACSIGQCGRCRGRIVSLTDTHGQPCGHQCHLPEPWREQVALYPPCGGDAA